MYEQEKIKPYRADGEKTEQVEQMFDSIAHSYDRLNHVLSLGIDRGWRQKAIRQLEPFHPQEMLDVATGTGDFALLAARMLRPKRLLGCDLSEGMMQVAREKVKQAKLEKVIDFAKEDCTALTFAESSFDAITVAFGIRNFADLDKGLTEMHRVLRPNGKLIILELTAPEYFPMKQLFKVYARVVIPTVGKLLSKDRSAYDYLPNTIQVFPQGEVMRGILQKAGFQKVDFERLTLGICTLYLATK